jgi:hypothetical protein
MPLSAESEELLPSLLVFEGKSSRWAIPTTAIVSVQALTSSSESKLVDALLALGDTPKPDAGGNERVLLLRHGNERLSVLLRSRLSLLERRRGMLLDLPAALVAGAPLLSHLAIVTGEASLFVVSTPRLFELTSLAEPDGHGLLGAVDSR